MLEVSELMKEVWYFHKSCKIFPYVEELKQSEMFKISFSCGVASERLSWVLSAHGQTCYDYKSLDKTRTQSD